MDERGSLLIGLLFSGVILATLLIFVTVALPRYTTFPSIPGTNKTTGSNNSASTGGGGSPTALINQAESVKIQADLKALSTQMMAYYTQQGTYPDSLEELGSFGDTNSSNINYVKCSEESVVFYHNSTGYPGYTFQYGQATSVGGENPPSCP